MSETVDQVASEAALTASILTEEAIPGSILTDEGGSITNQSYLSSSSSTGSTANALASQASSLQYAGAALLASQPLLPVGLQAVINPQAASSPATTSGSTNSTVGGGTAATVGSATIGSTASTTSQNAPRLLGGANTLITSLIQAAATGTMDVSVTVIPGGHSYVAGSLSDTVKTAAGDNTVVLGTGADSVTSGGNDTISASGGAATISAGGMSDEVFGGSSSLTFINGSGSSTVVGGSGALAVDGDQGRIAAFATGAALLTGGALGSNALVAGTGNATLNGAGSNNLMVAGSAGADLITAGTGDDTIFAGGAIDKIYSGVASSMIVVGSTGNDVLDLTGDASAVVFGGSGPESITCGAGSLLDMQGAGQQTVGGGAGSAHVFEGKSADLYTFTNGTAGGSLYVIGFKVGADMIELSGYGFNAAANAVTAAEVGSGGTMLSLTDGTSIMLAGVTGVTTASFA